MNKKNRSRPYISVVLATYNGAAYLPQLMDSLCLQTVLPYEIIVCDDSSHDTTIKILNDYIELLPLRIYTNKQQLGVVKNFQRAVSLCSGDYIAFCDQDDVWLPQKLAQSVNEIKKIDGPWPVVVFSDLIVVDQNLNLVASSYWQHRQLSPQKEIFASLIYGNVVTGCTMLINQSMAKEVARMPQNILMHDFWIACIAYSIGRYAFIREPTILYRQHTGNVTKNEAVTWYTRLKSFLFFIFKAQETENYLLAEICQAQMFANIYDNELSISHKASINRLFALTNKLPICRKWRVFLVKSLRINFK